MYIYKVPSDSPYQRPFRILASGAIVVLLGVWLFSVYEPSWVSDSTNKTIGMAAGAIALTAIVAVLTLSGKVGRWTLTRTSQWELDEEKIRRRGSDGQTAEIPLKSIKSLREDHGWLFIWGGEPPLRIAVPTEVNDFEELKRKLGTYCDLAAPRRGFSRTVNFIPFILASIAYGCLFLSRNRPVVVISGVVALLLQGLATYFFWLLWRKRRMPKSVIFSLALSCLIVAWIVYKQIHAVL